MDLKNLYALHTLKSIKPWIKIAPKLGIPDYLNKIRLAKNNLKNSPTLWGSKLISYDRIYHFKRTFLPKLESTTNGKYHIKQSIYNHSLFACLLEQPQPTIKPFSLFGKLFGRFDNLFSQKQN